MRINYIKKELLVELIKKVFTQTNVAWSGPFGLNKNKIDDIAYLCWSANNQDNLGRKGWDLYNLSIKYYGLKELKKLALGE